MDPSLFRIISIGYAAENKKLSSKDIEISPVEMVPYMDGELTANPTKLAHSGVDSNGKSYSTEFHMGNTFNAKWLQWGSNRVTPPDIRRGERLLIWQYADADTYYWTTTGLDDVLRRLETVVWAFSATKDESTKVLNIDNCYTVEVSTHKKLITVRTSKANGEPFIYTFQINADKGGVTLADDIGNYLELNSKEKRWTMKNADGSYLLIDKKTMEQFAEESIKLKTKAYTLEASDTITEKTKTASLEATTSITRKTATYDNTASTGATFTTPKAMFSALVNVTGLLTMAGGMAATAGAGGAAPTAKIDIPLAATKAATFSNGLAVTGGALTHMGVNVGSTHTHVSSAPGSPTSTPS